MAVHGDKVHGQIQAGGATASNAPATPRSGGVMVPSTEELWKWKGLNRIESLATFQSSQEEHHQRLDRASGNAKSFLQDRRRQQLRSIQMKEVRHANAARDRVL